MEPERAPAHAAAMLDRVRTRRSGSGELREENRPGTLRRLGSEWYRA
jgi:hypothetical protein